MCHEFWKPNQIYISYSIKQDVRCIIYISIPFSNYKFECVGWCVDLDLMLYTNLKETHKIMFIFAYGTQNWKKHKKLSLFDPFIKNRIQDIAWWRVLVLLAIVARFRTHILDSINIAKPKWQQPARNGIRASQFFRISIDVHCCRFHIGSARIW